MSVSQEAVTSVLESLPSAMAGAEEGGRDRAGGGSSDVVVWGGVFLTQDSGSSGKASQSEQFEGAMKLARCWS